MAVPTDVPGFAADLDGEILAVTSSAPGLRLVRLVLSPPNTNTAIDLREWCGIVRTDRRAPCGSVELLRMFPAVVYGRAHLEAHGVELSGK